MEKSTLSGALTFCICTANSLVGDKTRACVSLTCVSSPCSMEMENVAVLPVPDCALKKLRLNILGTHCSEEIFKSK